ncbi:MAG TPA: Ig-like domain-containing protein, partial [Patescibacteria group bacterium]|nr:Ig-like domain-containing protein [Patescibacteria group bacterium]
MRRTIYRISAGLCTLALVGLLMPIPKAYAGIGIGVAPDFPATVSAGSTNVPAGLDITNTSTPDIGPITLDTIFLTPQCGDSSVPCTSPDPGVFSVHTSGTGSGACSGITFTITTVDPATGRVSLTPSSVITLALGATCRINFLIDVLKLPTVDASAAAGIQTVQSGEVTSHDSLGLPGTGTGTDTVTVIQAQSTIVTTPSAGGPVGSTISDSATVTGLNPTGTVTFALFAPGDVSCANPVAISHNALVGGVALSDFFTATQVGTYNFTAVYGGDANNLPAVSGCGAETVVIGPASPTLSTITSVGTATVGAVVFDTAILSGAFNPTGTITFLLFAPSDPTCTSPIFTSSVPVAGNGSYTSGTTTLSQIGTYNFLAVYSGDSKNASISTNCGEEPITVSERPVSHTRPCIAVKFYSPRRLYLNPPTIVSKDAIFIGGINFNTPVAPSSKHVKMALNNSKGLLGALNQQFVAFQLGISIGSGGLSSPTT